VKIASWQKFRCLIENRTVHPTHVGDEWTDCFVQPATTPGVPKVYIVEHDGEIIYVGMATQSIANRLRQGMKAKGLHGYHGYRWHSLSEVDITVLTFDSVCNPDEIETFEAEFVYLVRKLGGDWPRYQTEIHFHPAEKELRALVEGAYDRLKGVGQT
jgi:hypothetical protein